MNKIIKYKLTNQNLQTHNNFRWKVRKWVKVKGKLKQSLCTDGWLHCYDSPLLAVLHNPIHAAIENPRLWEVEVDGECKNDRGLKCGYRRMRLFREIPVPNMSIIQRKAYGILCAKEVVTDNKWNLWADNWLSGKDRTANAAYAAANAAADAAYAAADAAYAADAAAYAVNAANAAYAVNAANAAYAAAYAAYAAAYAADAARPKTINFVKLAKQAMSFEY